MKSNRAPTWLALLLAACGSSTATPRSPTATPGEPTATPGTGTLSVRRVADAPVGRNGHLAITLAEGSALVMGGSASHTVGVTDSSTSHRFDMAKERFTAGPPLALSAFHHAYTNVVPLRAGAFLLVGGGLNSGVPPLAPSDALTQRFDPVRARFARSGDLQRERSGDFAATLLADGRVLVTGGGIPSVPLSEIYDPATDRWQISANLLVARRGHSATLLPDGRVLVAGGLFCCTENTEFLSGAAEIFDPATGSFALTGTLQQARAFHRATLLADGRVLLSGGYVTPPPQATARIAATATSEIFDPATGKFSTTNSMQVARVDHSALLLRDGRVLVVAGFRAEDGDGIAQTELFDASTGTWSAGPLVPPPSEDVLGPPPSAGSTATLLGNGKVLGSVGRDTFGFPRATAYLLE